MPLLGAMLKNRRAGDSGLAWNLPDLAGPDTITLRSADFADGRAIPQAHTGRRSGGANTSPALAWGAAPDSTAQWLLVVQDIDSPTRSPIVHLVALITPKLEGVRTGALESEHPTQGVQLLRGTLGRGYRGPEPIKGHGPHRYVFQIFALAKPLTTTPNGKPVDSAKLRTVLAAVTEPVLARGRLDGIYER